MDVAELEAERPRLTAIAARVLGTDAEADDVIQEAWLRLSSIETVEDPPALLTTVVTRLCLDQLRRRQTRSAAESAARTDAPADTARVDPEADVLLAEQVGDAMQVVLGTLAPAERVAFVLHDVFGYPFEQISVALGRSDTAVRKLASRARRKVRGAPEPVEEQQARAESREVVDAFLSAARGGELSDLLNLLAPDAVMRADAVGERMGTQQTYDGAAAVAARFHGGARGARPATIDGEPGLAWIVGGRAKVAFTFWIDDGLVREIELIADPEILATLDLTHERTDS
ncbi:RNA polymerase subunit sigma-70 [Nocardia nova]|uniref:RNA polymerase subunit sigma-70 n=2 Tax=Nocardia nova TaxID=37330 RepID=A0A2S6AXR8_9NOCA|nr:sigma-70 family RNA polymerase sigma factor [Nocardia nova]PPJ34145.1 RNA polymerase subunit sigma-70 [Nocardia nova]PPJ40045.1 RNA polymerase subunit sigma-70 [Nocardia nova]